MLLWLIASMLKPILAYEPGASPKNVVCSKSLQNRSFSRVTMFGRHGIIVASIWKRYFFTVWTSTNGCSFRTARQARRQRRARQHQHQQQQQQVAGSTSRFLSLSLFHLQFHQHLTSSFYTRRSQKHKEDSLLKQLFALSGSVGIKAVRKHVDEIDPLCLFHISFCCYYYYYYYSYQRQQKSFQFTFACASSWIYRTHKYIGYPFEMDRREPWDRFEMNGQDKYFTCCLFIVKEHIKIIFKIWSLTK